VGDLQRREILRHHVRDGFDRVFDLGFDHEQNRVVSYCSGVINNLAEQKS
jgi:hypothetical protein